jgi:hypothetical protein
MCKASAAVVLMISAIALYFTLVWGFDALRVLTSPTYGLDDVWRSQVVFEIGRMFRLNPDTMISLAVFFGVLKLTVAGVCGVHVIDRIRSLIHGKADAEILEAGLIMVAAISIAAVIPALWTHNTDLVREQTIPLLLASLAAALCVMERTDTVAATEATEPVKRTIEIWHPTWYSPWRR